MTKRIYLTVANRPYLPRLSVLLASMREYCAPFLLYVLDWDRETFEWCLRQGGDVHPIGGNRYPRKPDRSDVENMWTLRWRALQDIVESDRPVTMLDADLAFHASPEPVFAEIGSAPAAVTPHRFAPAAAGLPGPTVESHSKYGMFNAGFTYVADPRIAAMMARATDWWCHTRVEFVFGCGWWMRTFGLQSELWKRLLYADQVYLNDLPALGAHVIQHPGVNVGPWNTHTIDPSAPLIAYHYHSLKTDGAGTLIQHAYPEYGITPAQVDRLYRPYVEQLLAAERAGEF